MKVYIQKVDGQFADDWVFAAYIGFRAKKTHEIIFFEDIMEVPVGNMVVAYIEDTKQYFQRCGIEVPLSLNIPDELQKYLHRKVSVMTFREFKETPIPYGGIFIKPYNEFKTFPSGVIKNESSKNNLSTVMFGDVADTDLCLVSEVVNMLTEYRVFINRGEIVGIKHYSGDFRLFPDFKVIEQAFDDYKSGPISFTIDFAVDDKGQTILVEVQDAWSIGNYGLDGEVYSRFLMDRWLQIFKRI